MPDPFPILICPTTECGRPVRVIDSVVDGFIHASGKKSLKGYIVECPEHGTKILDLRGEKMLKKSTGYSRR